MAEWAALWSPILWRICKVNDESKRRGARGQMGHLPGTILSAALIELRLSM
jgi:hypothetical protein